MRSGEQISPTKSERWVTLASSRAEPKCAAISTRPRSAWQRSLTASALSCARLKLVAADFDAARVPAVEVAQGDGIRL